MKNDNFLNTYKKVRKPMPPPEKVIANEKDVRKRERFDWRKEMENLEEDDYKGIDDGK